jgi:hypothetical protein
MVAQIRIIGEKNISFKVKLIARIIVLSTDKKKVTIVDINFQKQTAKGVKID